MFLQNAAQDTLPKGDPIALAIVLVVLAVFTVSILIRNSRRKKAAAIIPAPAPAEKPVTVIPKAPGSAGNLKLYNVEPKTAAIVMAIVADKMGKPLNELRFISIKEID